MLYYDTTVFGRQLSRFCLLRKPFNTVFILGNAVKRSIGFGNDEIRNFSSTEADSSRKLYLHIIGLLENSKKQAILNLC